MSEKQQVIPFCSHKADKDIANEVMTVHTYVPVSGEPDAKWDQQMKDIKALGRKVKNFVPEQWSEVCINIMVRGLYAKFSQNSHCREALLATGDALLCEAASYDKVWGIGMGAADPRVQDPSQWEGKNLLGQCLMTVRSTLRSEQ